MGNYKKPNFIIGGTAAGGTSFLSAALVQHPEIYLPARMRPEPHYFYKSWEFEKGFDNYLQQWFQEVPDSAIAIGERSSSYLFGGNEVAVKIHDELPDVKLIFTLRNPIERTWANYRYTVLQGLEDLSFEDALANEAERIRSATGIWAEIQPHNYTGRGFYGRQLKEYLQVFSASQMLILKSETLGSDTRQELGKVYGFLDLNDLDFEPSTPPNHTAVNVLNPAVQMNLRGYFDTRFDTLIEAVRKCEDIERFIETDEDKNAINELTENMKGKKESMPDAARKYLQDLFRTDIETLADSVDFDLSDWK